MSVKFADQEDRWFKISNTFADLTLIVKYGKIYNSFYTEYSFNSENLHVKFQGN